MTYEENVLKTATDMAKAYDFLMRHCDAWEGLSSRYKKDLISSYDLAARIAVRLQAEAFEAAYRILDANVDQTVGWFNLEGEYTRGSLLNNYLIERGLIPAQKGHEQPVKNNEQVEPALIILNLLLNNPSINLGDMVYMVRDNEGKGWEGPDVKAWCEAVEKAKKLLNNYPEIPPPEAKECLHEKVNMGTCMDCGIRI